MWSAKKALICLSQVNKVEPVEANSLYLSAILWENIYARYDVIHRLPAKICGSQSYSHFSHEQLMVTTNFIADP